MAVEMACPGCGRVYRVDGRKPGDRLHCVTCRAEFTVGSGNDQTQPPAMKTVAPRNVPPPPSVVPQPSKPTVAPAVFGPAEKLPRKLGRFELRTKVGAGSFGEVYRAFDETLKREVALKLPHAVALLMSGAEDRFLREAITSAQLQHPNIVAVYDAGKIGDQPYIAAAFIQGQTLQYAMKQERFDVRRAIDIVRKLAEALAYAHSLGIVHRDVKPANVMLDAAGEPRLMDFGIARRADPAAGPDAGDSLDDRAAGTPLYMSPEQAGRLGAMVGAASDQYALGTVLFEILTGRPPFEADCALPLLLKRIRDDAPPGLRFLRTEIDRDLEAICLKTLAKRPEERYVDAAGKASCQSLADDLRRRLDDDPVTARGIGPIERTTRWCRKRPATAGLTLVTAALLLVVALVSTIGAARMAVLRNQESESRASAEAASRLAEQRASEAEAAQHTAESERAAAENERKRAETALTNEAAALGKEAEARKLSEQRAAELAQKNTELTNSRAEIIEKSRALEQSNTELATKNSALAEKSAELQTALDEVGRQTTVATRAQKIAELKNYAISLERIRILIRQLPTRRPGDPISTAQYDFKSVYYSPHVIRDWEYDFLREAAREQAGIGNLQRFAGGATLFYGSLARHNRRLNASLNAALICEPNDLRAPCQHYACSTGKVTPLKNCFETYQSIYVPAISRDGRYVVGRHYLKAAVCVWDSSIGESILDLENSGDTRNNVKHFGIRDDQKELFAIESDSITTWDFGVGSLLTKIKKPVSVTGGFRFGAYCNEGRHIVVVCDDDTLLIIDPRIGTPIVAVIRPQEGKVISIAVSQDGAFIAIARSIKPGNTNITFMYASNGVIVSSVDIESIEFPAIVFTPTGKRVIAASDRSVKIIDVETAVCVLSLPDKREFSASGVLQFDSTGKWLVGSHDLPLYVPLSSNAQAAN